MMTAGRAYLAFAAFGALWGAWGAALPSIRDAAGVDEGQLGLALLCVGAGAVPAMLLTGRAADRSGGKVVAAALLLLALTGLGVSTLARGPVWLALWLLLLGATSGAADVGANALAGAADRAGGRPVLTRAHGVFSASVVVSSLLTGGVQAVGWPVGVAFGVVVLLASVAAISCWAIPAAVAPAATGGADAPAARSTVAWLAPLVAVGLVGALAFAVENAHQSWGAVYLADELDVSGGLSSSAPAAFAGVAALVRFGMGAFGHLPPGPVLTVGAGTAAAGSFLLSVAPTPGLALAGLALAAAGTSVLFPTVLREVLRGVQEASRGRATAALVSTAYLGYTLGPVLVGVVAQVADLRVAMATVAGVATLAGVLAWPVTRWATLRPAVHAGAHEPGPP